MLDIPGEGPQVDTEQFECEIDASDANGVSGMSYPIQAEQGQNQALLAKLKRGELVSGESLLDLPNVVLSMDKKIVLPPGLEVRVTTPAGANRRKLAVVTGNKPILAVKVFDVNNLAHPHTPAQMSDNIFGTNGDPVNLASQLNACSMDQLNIVTDYDSSVSTALLSATGVLEVNIGVDLTTNSRATIRNAVTAAVQTKLGVSLPGPFQQVMYNLQGCYVDCGWAAYAYINSWNSVYQGNYYYMTGVQVHELGHNVSIYNSLLLKVPQKLCSDPFLTHF